MGVTLKKQRTPKCFSELKLYFFNLKICLLVLSSLEAEAFILGD